MQKKQPVLSLLVLDDYRHFLSQHKISARLHGFYVRWLRLYLTFCQSAALPALDPDQISLFLNAMTREAHSTFLQHQAEQAIVLYLNMVSGTHLKKERKPEPQGKDTPHHPENFNQAEAACVRHGASPKPDPIAAPSANSRHQPPNTSDLNLKTWQTLLQALEAEIKMRHYSTKTLKAYKNWLLRFQTFVQHQSPEMLNSHDVKRFLSALATDHQVSASTQNQAFNALLFVFTQLLKRPFHLKDVVRARRKAHIPVVLSRPEIDLILAELDSPYKLVAQLLYGCGLRLSEALSLRIQDLNFDHGLLTVHRGKGQKDRSLPLPRTLYSALEQQLERVRISLQQDLQNPAYAGVFLPDVLAQKYKQASKSFAWQWLFPALKLTHIPDTGENRRFHLHDTHVQRAIQNAVQKAMLCKRASAHSFRHSFASHLLQANVDICTIQALLGHSDVRTTMIYLQTVPRQTLQQAISPLDLSSSINP